jgi:hypothetical protein
LLYRNTNISQLFLFLGLGIIHSAFAQTIGSRLAEHSLVVPVEDTLMNSVSTDTIPDDILFDTTAVDTTHTSIWPAFIRSAIIPGWGQIEQEHPGRAVIFYGLSLTFLYNIAYNYYWYQETKSYSRKVSLRRYTIFFLQLYALNLVDIYESHRRGNDKPWPEELFSDLPLKSPWGAVARSAMLPGWGQCYNQSYIKSVIALGAFSYFFSRIYKYGKQYRDTGNIEFRDKRITNTWYLGLTYLIIMADAYVDAYLYRFDDSIKLTYYYLPEEKAFSIGVNIEF